MHLDDWRQFLKQHRQSHLLQFWEVLDAGQRRELMLDLEGIDWPALAAWQSSVAAEPAGEGALQPPEALPAAGQLDAHAIGEQLLRDGAVAALTVAGGQGSRLGFDGPKGLFPITPLRQVSLFQWFAEFIVASDRRYGCSTPWFVMTSPENRAATEAFFGAHDHFGLAAGQVHFFNQGTMPVLAADGTILLADRHRVALAPDGHGGTLKALQASGGLDHLLQSKVRYISYFQVDNPLVIPLDPRFLGTVHLRQADVAAKGVRKAYPAERVGVFVQEGRLTRVIEYVDLPESLRDRQAPDGSSLFDLANMAVHVFDTAFLQRVATSGDGLPWHPIRRAFAHIDPASGNMIRPDQPNAIKLERFIFDTLPLADRTLLYEVQRADEFSPVKNATGNDSPAQARRDLSIRAWRWLEECGITPPSDPPDAEISPLFALDVPELRERLTHHPTLEQKGVRSLLALLKEPSRDQAP